MLCHGFEGGGGSRKSRKTVSWSSGLEGGVGLAVDELAVGGFRGRTGPSRARSPGSYNPSRLSSQRQWRKRKASDLIHFQIIGLGVEWLLCKMDINYSAVNQNVVKNAHDNILAADELDLRMRAMSVLILKKSDHTFDFLTSQF